jgi:hypothetical protein
VLGTFYQSSTQSAAANWSRTFSAAAVNELRLGFSRVTIDDARNGAGLDWAGIGDYNAQLGIPGGQRIAGMSGFAWDSSGLSNIGSAAALSESDDKVFQLSEKFSFLKGRHFLSAGAQVLHLVMNRFYAGNEGTLGSFTFSGDVTGNAFSDFLLDKVSRKGIGGGASGDPWEQSQNRVGLYLQDDFKASSNLTINLGLRWEYTSPLVEKNNQQVNIDLVTGETIQPGGAFGDGLYDSYYKGFAPRLGFAWTPNDATVVRGGYGIVQYMEGTGANTRLTMNPPFFTEKSQAYAPTAAGSLSVGFGDLGPGSGQPRAYQQDLRPQFTQQWNAFIERRLSPSMSISAGYVGSHSAHLVAFRGMNQALPGVGNPANWAPENDRRPLSGLRPDIGLIRYTSSDATANYNGLQLSLRQRRKAGLEFLASYTFSKALTDNQGFYGPGWGGGGTGFTHFNQGTGDGNQNSYDMAADYGPALFDATHVGSVAVSYELPFGKGRSKGAEWSGLADALLGGWNVSSIVSVRSGFPVTVNQGWGGTSLQGNFAYQRVDRLPGVDPNASSPDWDGWINPAAFTTPAQGTFGDSGVGILRGPGFWNVDLGIDKDFHLGSSRYLTFRIEAFNALNHSNKGMPVRNFFDPDFGKVLTVANQARILEFAAKLRF